MKGIGRCLCQTLHKMKVEVYAISRTKADLDSLERGKQPSTNYFCKQ